MNSFFRTSFCKQGTIMVLAADSEVTAVQFYRPFTWKLYIIIWLFIFSFPNLGVIYFPISPSWFPNRYKLAAMVIVLFPPLFLYRGMTTDSMRAPNSTFNVLLNSTMLSHTGAENKCHMTVEVTVRFEFLMRRHFLPGGESECPFCVNWKGWFFVPQIQNAHCRWAPFIESPWDVHVMLKGKSCNIGSLATLSVDKRLDESLIKRKVRTHYICTLCD